MALVQIAVDRQRLRAGIESLLQRTDGLVEVADTGVGVGQLAAQCRVVAALLDELFQVRQRRFQYRLLQRLQPRRLLQFLDGALRERDNLFVGHSEAGVGVGLRVFGFAAFLLQCNLALVRLLECIFSAVGMPFGPEPEHGQQRHSHGERHQQGQRQPSDGRLPFAPAPRAFQAPIGRAWIGSPRR